MGSQSFILEHLEEILVEWEAFARTLSPASNSMDSLALRDHAKQMLQAIAKDIESSQSDAEQARKSKGLGPVFHGKETAASAHGILRHAVGFDLGQLVAEFRALRATVLRLWAAKENYGDAQSAYEMTRFNEAIDQALAESVAAYSGELGRSRDTFLAILGHDLRGPLSALGGALHVLASPGVAEAKRLDAFSAGTRGVSNMSAMIRDLLEFTRSRLGKGIPIDPSPGDLGDVCVAAIEEARLASPQSRFDLECHGSLAGRFDAARVQQALSNLLNNAVQHGSSGSPILLTATGDAATVTLKVRNRGTPIASEFHEAIFDPLVQVPPEKPETPRSTNLGLGLFIAREIVHAHRGKIEVTSSADGWTEFTATLPRGSS